MGSNQSSWGEIAGSQAEKERMSYEPQAPCGAGRRKEERECVKRTLEST